jgi:hypothetical protein
MIQPCPGATCRMVGGMLTHIQNEEVLSCDVHAKMYFAMEKAELVYDKKRLLIFHFFGSGVLSFSFQVHQVQLSAFLSCYCVKF